MFSRDTVLMQMKHSAMLTVVFFVIEAAVTADIRVVARL
tara:strand:+ start:1093 stop:1209 length:117 start_codon:yes stop_codon:yes gene_type:complete